MEEIENSMINKIYMFQFVNTYISNFVYTFWYQSFNKLQYNMVIVMIFKQIFYNVLEYFLLRYNHNSKFKKVRKEFDAKKQELVAKGASRVELEDLKMHKRIIAQSCMTNLPSTLVFYYNEAVIQMGFIAFFAVSFPFAPLFSFLTNLLEIKIKLDIMERYGKRNHAEQSSGIGNWMAVFEFISYFAIPVNLGILLYARDPQNESGVGYFQNLDEVTIEEQSAMTRWLMNKGEYWTRTNIFILAIVVEHLIIALKIVIAVLVPDVPKVVQESEKCRPTFEQQAEKEIKVMKAAR